MGQIGPSHHDFGAGDAMTRSTLKLKTGSKCCFTISHIMALQTDKPCNDPQMGVLKDKQDFIWNEWVRLGHPTMILGWRCHGKRSILKLKTVSKCCSHECYHDQIC